MVRHMPNVPNQRIKHVPKHLANFRFSVDEQGVSLYSRLRTEVCRRAHVCADNISTARDCIYCQNYQRFDSFIPRCS